MKIADFSNIHFEEEVAIYFDYKCNRYVLVIDFDDEGYLMPTFFHETSHEENGKSLYACYHCSPHTKPKVVRGNNIHYEISPYSAECMYLNPIANKVVRCLFQNETIQNQTKK